MYASVISGVSPVLILHKLEQEDVWHAVVVAGIKVDRIHKPCLIGKGLDDRAGDLAGLYIHDDRIGPYLAAGYETTDSALRLRIDLDGEADEWTLTHMLIPMHPKVRLSFGELFEVGLKLLHSVHVAREELIGREPKFAASWESWITRSHKYLESLFVAKPKVRELLLERLCSQVAFSRYVAVVRIRATDLDPIDVLLDTTSTERNPHFLAVVQTSDSRPNTTQVAGHLSRLCSCKKIS